MKKVVLIMCVAVSSMLSANAQFYLGGSLNLGSTVNKPENGDKTTVSTLTLNPELGYTVIQDLELGGSLLISNHEDAQDCKSTEWSISPYARYSFVEFGKFSVWGQAGLLLGGSSYERIEGGGNKVDYSTSELGLNIVPVLKYSLSNHFDLISRLNFLNINFSQITTERESDNVGTTINFTLGANSHNVATLGNISIGFIYKF
jgi:hypothetical protein